MCIIGAGLLVDGDISVGDGVGAGAGGPVAVLHVCVCVRYGGGVPPMHCGQVTPGLVHRTPRSASGYQASGLPPPPPHPLTSLGPKPPD